VKGAVMKFPSIDSNGRTRTPYAIYCEGPWDLPGGGHELVYLTESEYNLQMDAPSKTWRCPICKYEAQWNDENFEKFFKETSK